MRRTLTGSGAALLLMTATDTASRSTTTPSMRDNTRIDSATGAQ